MNTIKRLHAHAKAQTHVHVYMNTQLTCKYGVHVHGHNTRKMYNYLRGFLPYIFVLWHCESDDGFSQSSSHLHRQMGRVPRGFPSATLASIISGGRMHTLLGIQCRHVSVYLHLRASPDKWLWRHCALSSQMFGLHGGGFRLL